MHKYMEESKPEKKIFECQYCGRQYKSKQALSNHEKKCERRDPAPEPAGNDDDNGIELFKDESSPAAAPAPAAADEEQHEKIIYRCWNCKHEQESEFDYCPECSAYNRWK